MISTAKLGRCRWCAGSGESFFAHGCGTDSDWAGACGPVRARGRHAARVTAHAQRKIPYHSHFDPCPSFRSAVGAARGKQLFVGAGVLAYMNQRRER